MALHDHLARWRDEDTGELRSWAWPGGYPIVYITKESATLCPTYANKEEDQQTIASGSIEYEEEEESPTYCDECGNVLVASMWVNLKDGEEKND